jgi:hypothetical protein
MRRWIAVRIVLLGALSWSAFPGQAAELQLLRAAADPFGCPRPAPGASNVPCATSFYLEIGLAGEDTTDQVDPDSVTVRLRAAGDEPVDLLRAGRRFVNGYTGTLAGHSKKRSAVVVNIDGGPGLKPGTAHQVIVVARSRDGVQLRDSDTVWCFTTEQGSAENALSFPLDLDQAGVVWRGGFFTGFCKPSFCTSASNRIDGYELMARIRQDSPRAWSLQRDFSLTGMQRQPSFLPRQLPNIVRERETRRIIALDQTDDGTVLCVEDFFGHQQYGIASERPVADDYRPGDTVLITDGQNHARADVVAVLDDAQGKRRLLVTPLAEPEGGWQTQYAGPLPERENPDAPGLFPPGGCYLQKFSPPGTPCYYWGRVDKEFDIARRFERRLVVNFVEAPGDLSVDGGDFTYPKDYAVYHQAVHVITTHLIERYGDVCLDDFWSVFNEPDLSRAFWRSGDWIELQRFYDYTVDAILRAFEDQGYDSDRVLVGGLELGAIFGTHIEEPLLGPFLAHCSPTATRRGALPQNAAVADSRLDGRRSRRVERLCGAAGGQGSPCDFVSVHSYNAASMTAAKLIRAKQIALEIDADYYADLWINCHESCPDWAPPPDQAAADCYLGNGYFPTWCADVARRSLSQAAEDPRYGFGESILTFWPWPNQNFDGQNNATRVLHIDDDGDGRTDRRETVAMPILNFLALLARMGDRYWPLPEQTVGGHVVSGFATRDATAVSICLYSHHEQDVQSRSAATFDIALQLCGIPWSKVRIEQYAFDKEHNSYFRPGRALRERGRGPSPTPDQAESLISDLTSGDRALQLAAIRRAATFGSLPASLGEAAFGLYEQTEDPEIRKELEQAGQRIQARQVCYSPKEVNRVRKLSTLRVTDTAVRAGESDGQLNLQVPLAGNGANFLVIRPVEAKTDEK